MDIVRSAGSIDWLIESHHGPIKISTRSVSDVGRVRVRSRLRGLTGWAVLSPCRPARWSARNRDDSENR